MPNENINLEIDSSAEQCALAFWRSRARTAVGQARHDRAAAQAGGAGRSQSWFEPFARGKISRGDRGIRARACHGARFAGTEPEYRIGVVQARQFRRGARGIRQRERERSQRATYNAHRDELFWTGAVSGGGGAAEGGGRGAAG